MQTQWIKQLKQISYCMEMKGNQWLPENVQKQGLQIIWFIECQKTEKMPYSFLKPKSSYVLFCQTDTLKPENIQFTFTGDKAKQEIPRIQKLDIGNLWCFGLKNDSSDIIIESINHQNVSDVQKI